MKPSPYRPAPKCIAARARPETTGRSQTRPGFSFGSPLSNLCPDGRPPRRVQKRSDAVGVEVRGRFGGILSTSQSETAGVNSRTPAACSGTAEAGDRQAPSPLPSRTDGRRCFLGLGALLGGAGAYGAHDRFTGNPVERRAEPYSGPITLAHETPTLVQTHAENSSPAVVPGKLSLTVEYGAEESIGGVRFREIRGVRRVS